MGTFLDYLTGRRPETRALDRGTAAPLLLGSGSAEGMSATRALGIADALACVRVLAESAASLPLHIYRPGDGGRQRVRSGALPTLIDRPAPGVTTSSLVGQVVAHLALHGNVYLGKYRGPGGAIQQLGVIDPAAVTVKVERGVPVYQLARAEGVTRHGVEDILHIRGPLSLDGVLGVSPIGVLRHTFALADALGSHARQFAENAARPSGVLKVAHAITSEQSESLKGAFSRRQQGAERAGGVAVMTGEVDWMPLSMSLVDAEFIEQRRLSTAEVCRAFRVPPWMVGADAGDSLTYSNTESQAAAFLTFSLRPWLVAIEQAISADQDLAPGSLYAEFVIDALLRADTKTRADVYRLALDPQRGWMTRAEVRERENLPPEDNPPSAPIPGVA